MRPACCLLFALPGLFSWAQGPVPKQKPTLQVTLQMPTQLGDPVFDRVTAPLGVVDGVVQAPLVGVTVTLPLTSERPSSAWRGTSWDPAWPVGPSCTSGSI